jgi:hypothetical protein
MRVFAWIALLAWAAFLYWGVKASTGWASPCTLAGPLPLNHLLSAADFNPASSGGAVLYNGLYLKRALPKDSPLRPEDVSDSPLLRIAPDSTIFPVVLSNDDANKRDADQQFDLGTGSTVIAKQSRVVAVLCPSRAVGKCEAMFEVPQSALKQLVEAPGQVGIVDSPKVVPQQSDANAPQDPAKTEKQKTNEAVKQPGQR